MTPSDKPLPTFGRFEVIRTLGEGGMGKVYLALDPSIGREVAIKTIHTEGVVTPKLKERFWREAKAAGALSHPNLVTVHEFGESEGTLFIVMEYLPGEDLSALLFRRSLTPTEVLEILAQVCDGLAYAHAKGVLHRDVKPGNVRVQRIGGRVHAKVMDFGVARVEGSQLTATGDLVGTFNYMAPEYLRTGKPDVRCDLYAVGMILHEGLTGDLPAMVPTLASGPTHGGPSEAGHPTLEGVSAHTFELVEKALAPAARRFDSAEHLASLLRAAQNPTWPGLAAAELPVIKTYPGDISKSDVGAPPTAGRRAFQPVLRPEEAPGASPRMLWALLILLGAALAGGIWWTQGRRSGPVQTAAAQAPVVAPTPVVVKAPNPVGTEAPASAPSEPPPPRKDAPPEPRPEAPPGDREGRPGAPEPSRRQVALDQVMDRVRERPREVLEAAEALLREQPGNARAHAYRLASLYWLGRYPDLLTALDEAQRQQVHAGEFGRNPCIREMMEDNRSQSRMPRETVERIRAFLPPPPGGEGRPGQEPRKGDRDPRN